MLTLEHYEKLDSYLPIDFTSFRDFILAFFVISFFVIARYFASVFPFYFYFWLKKERPSKNYLYPNRVSRDQVRLEIKYSILSSFVFAWSGVLIGYMWKKGMTQIYLKLDLYGYSYLFLSFLCLALIHEIYFYFTHRWMHQKTVFKHVHRIHHLSRDTSPWASFSFHPFEALVLAAFLPLIVLVIPLHPLVIIAYMVFMTLSAISNHLGVEIFNNSQVLQYFISGTHHAVHHKKMNSNYGLYFCFMDQIFRTENTKRVK